MADNIFDENKNAANEISSNPYIKKEDRSEAAAPKANNPAENTQSAPDMASTEYSMVRPEGGTTYFRPQTQTAHSSGGTNPGGDTFRASNAQNGQTVQNPYGAYTAPGAAPYSQFNPQYGYNPVNPGADAYRKNRREKKRMSGDVIALICALCVVLSGAAGFGGAYVAMRNGPSFGGTVQNDPAVIYKSVSTDASAAATSVTDVVNTVADSVVEITTEFKSTGYFQYVSSGAGSGVVISENGYIITNNHVITDNNTVADNITVRLKSGDEYTASVVGHDADTDIAVLKIDATGLTAAVFADSSKLVVGQDVIAIGNPLGSLGGTVTTGIISALDREIDVGGTMMNLLQTNAAVNPGNSGGGLFNMSGELVGIVNAKSSGENVEGLGFAIPANDASKVAEELMTNGYVTGKAYIGVSLYYASDSYTAYRNFRNSSPGLYIAQVVEGYNDDVLKFGDRIIAVDGTEVSSADDVKAIVKKCEIGSTMKFSLYRDGKLIEVDVKCYEYKPEKTDVDFSEVQ